MACGHSFDVITIRGLLLLFDVIVIRGLLLLFDVINECNICNKELIALVAGVRITKPLYYSPNFKFKLIFLKLKKDK